MPVPAIIGGSTQKRRVDLRSVLESGNEGANDPPNAELDRIQKRQVVGRRSPDE